MKKIFLLFALLINVSVNAQWSAVGGGTNGDVYSLAVYNGELYAGGTFNMAGGISANYIARWNGTSWD